MNCPQCGAAAQPYDRFCIRCGHDMQPNGADAPERGPSAATYSPNIPSPSARTAVPSAPMTPPPYAGAAYGDGMGAPPAQQPYNNGTPPQGGWASGSSTPRPNPFGGPRSAPSNGTMLNGRPANADGKGLLQGVGAAIVAIFVVLGKFGGLVAGLGIFKLFFYWWLFSGLLHAGLGTLVLVVVIVLIVGAVARSRGMV